MGNSLQHPGKAPERDGTRRVKLIGGPIGQYTAQDIKTVGLGIDTIKAEDPEMIREAFIYVEEELGAIAVGVLATGPDRILHSRAPTWLKIVQLSGGEMPRGSHWRIDH